MKNDVTVCIPTIPPRVKELSRAVGSTLRQERPPQALSIAVDTERQGAWVTRTRAVSNARTEWVALLDDDDYFYPEHLRVLLEHAESDPSVDYWFTYFDVVGGVDPLGHFGKVWNPEDPTQTTTTVLVRTELAQKVGWVLPEPELTVGRQMAGEDFHFTLNCRDAGAKIVHIPQRTWAYVHHGKNTSGMPSRW